MLLHWALGSVCVTEKELMLIINNIYQIKGLFFFERERMSASGGRECRGAAAREGEREF